MTNNLPTGYAFARYGAVWKLHDTMAEALEQAEGVKASDAYHKKDRLINCDHQDYGPVTYQVETMVYDGNRWTTIAILDLTIGPAQRWL